MAKVWVLLLMLAVSTLFIHVPAVGKIGFILNPDVKLDYNQYFWMLCEHFIMVVLAVIIWDESQDYKWLMKVFLFIQIADTVAFILSYDDPLKDYLLSFNFIKLLIFGFAIGLEIWKSSNRS